MRSLGARRSSPEPSELMSVEDAGLVSILA
jgi:hypothetical protein